MTPVEMWITLCMAVLVGGEIFICLHIAKMFADIEVMRKEYLDLIKDINAERLKYFDEWGLAIDGWKKALTEWGDTIQIFTDYVHEKGDEQDGQT